jgi:hypothetical protein
MHREGGTTPSAGDLGGGTAEVQIDVVHADVVHQTPDRFFYHPGVDAVELHAAHRLVVAEGQHAHGFGVALHQSAGSDHLAHIETGSIGATEPAESHVGHSGHRSQYHRGINGDGAELERG